MPTCGYKCFSGVRMWRRAKIPRFWRAWRAAISTWRCSRVPNDFLSFVTNLESTSLAPRRRRTATAHCGLLLEFLSLLTYFKQASPQCLWTATATSSRSRTSCHPSFGGRVLGREHQREVQRSFLRRDAPSRPGGAVASPHFSGDWRSEHVELVRLYAARECYHLPVLLLEAQEIHSTLALDACVRVQQILPVTAGFIPCHVADDKTAPSSTGSSTSTRSTSTATRPTTVGFGCPLAVKVQERTVFSEHMFLRPVCVRQCAHLLCGTMWC